MQSFKKAPTKHRLRGLVSLIVLSSFVALISACTGADVDSGVRLVSVDSAADTLNEPPEGLVVLDVRTPEEYRAARLAGDATLVDFYEPDFAAQIATLDRDAPYLLYCRSGNRSGQAREIMEDLGFTNVSDVDGGINAWMSDGQPVVAG